MLNDLAILNPSSVQQLKGVRSNVQLRLTQEFVNGLGRTVTVITRSGAEFEIPATYGVRVNFLTVSLGFGFLNEVAALTRNLDNNKGHATAHEAELLKTVLHSDVRAPFNTMLESGISYKVELSDLTENGGSFYLQALDIVLTLLPPERRPPHPFSLEGVRKLMQNQSYAARANSGVSYQVKIVDNNGTYGNRYINLNGEVFYVRTEQNPALVDGVYLITHAPGANRSAGYEPRTLFFSYEESSEKLRLYSTYADAKTLGDPESVQKLEIETERQRLKRLETEIKEESLRRDAAREEERRQWERERAIIKRESELREDEMKRRDQLFATLEHEFRVQELKLKQALIVSKDTADSNSLFRKETAEWLKLAPAVVAGLGAAYLAYKKLKETK